MFAINGHTPEEYAAIHIHTEVAPPTPRIEWVSIPLRDGSINASRILSTLPFYDTREITLVMEIMALRGLWPRIRSRVMEDLHGQTVQLSIDNSEYYWEGVASVGPLEENGATASITITVTAQPFQKKSSWISDGTVSVSGVTTKTLKTNAMRSYLEFNASTTGLGFTYDGIPYTLASGKSTANGFFLPEGTHSLAFAGTGSVDIRHQEATL